MSEFLAGPHVAVLATVRASGMPAATPVWYAFEDGRFRLLVDRDSTKARNIGRGGVATICVESRGGQLATAVAECAAEVGQPPTLEERIALHRRYRGEAARDYVLAHPNPKLVTLWLTPKRWISWAIPGAT